MDADAFRRAAHAAIEEIIQHNQAVADGTRPVLPSIKSGYLRPLLPTAIPDQPQPWQEIQPDIASKIIPGLTNWQSPNFMAFFPACATYPSILGEMYSSAFTAPAFNWLCSPACTELETVVLDWIADALHLPSEFRSDTKNQRGCGGGVIQGSASEAIVTCMVAARERCMERICDREGWKNGSPEREKRIGELRAKLVALSSDQAHSSTQKGAIIAGTLYRSVPTSYEHALALQPAQLESVLQQCEKDGLIPYYITLTYGTTSTCAVDPFHLLEPVLRKYPDVWVHVDAAYAGTALICPEYASIGQGDSADNSPITTKIENIVSPITNGSNHEVENGTKQTGHQHSDLPLPLSNPEGALPHGPSALKFVDSFNTNLHKWLLTSFDASLLYIRNRHDLTSALSISPAYLQNKHSDSGHVTDYRDWQIPLGRRFRALKIWFVVRSYGLQGLRAHIRRTVGVGEYFRSLVEDSKDGRELFEIVAKPAFGLTCFRLRPEVVWRVRNRGRNRADTLTNGLTSDTETKATIDGSPSGTAEQQQNESTKQYHQERNGVTDEADVKETDDLASTLSKQIVETINDGGQLFLTASTAHGKSFIRVVCGNENAREENMKAAFEMIVAVARELLGKIGSK